MSKMRMVRQVGNILDNFTTKIEGNIYFGDYPMLALEGNKIRLFKMPANKKCRLGWLIPIGVPYVIKKSGREDLRKITSAINVAYQFGEKLYVHSDYYHANLAGSRDKKLYSPVVDKIIQLTKAGWEAAEQEDYNKFMWQYALKSTVGDFREVAKIDFDMAMSIDTEMLAKVGWTINQVLGRNAFYGIVTAGTKPVSRAKKKKTFRWYNKYLCAIDITGGNGLEVWGYQQYNSNQHPHIGSSGGLCRGSFGREIQDRLDKGLITEFFVMMLDFFEHYNSSSPFFKLPIPAGDADETRGRLVTMSEYLKSKIAFGEER
jgi:hypothetical protein